VIWLRRALIALIGLLVPLIAYGFIFIAILNAPWFSWYKNALSDLGAHQGSDIIFNTGLMIAGILETLFAYGLFKEFKDLTRRIGAAILVFSGIALFGIGLFPETYETIHLYFSIAFFVSFPFGIFALGLSYIRNKENLLLGILAVLFFVASGIIWAFPWKAYGITGVAIPEFLSSLCGTIYIIAISLELLKTGRAEKT